MAFVPAPNIVAVELRCTLDGQNVENTWHVNVFHEPTVADLVALANNIATVVIGSWLTNLSDQLTFREIHLRSLHTANGVEHTAAFPANTTGSLVSPVMPSNVTLCVSLRSQSSGRSARGRLYWMTLTELDVVGNTVASGRVGTIVGAVQDMIDQMVTIGYAWVIVSYITNNAPRVGGPVYFIVTTALVVDSIVDSQRRRLPGRGN